MKRVSNSLFLAGVLAAVISPAAKAQPLIYDNGPIYQTGPAGGYACGWNIGFFNVSDSFSVTSPTALTSVTAGIWTDHGASLESISWSIQNGPFGANVSSGVATTTDESVYTHTPTLANPQLLDVSEDNFAISGILTPGTYYLTLGGYLVTDDGYVGWDVNNGPSVAYFKSGLTPVVNASGSLFPGSNSNSFQIYGDVTPVTGTPEPGAYAMAAGLGLSGSTLLWRRRKKAWSRLGNR